MIICDAHADTLWKLARHPEGGLDLSLERLQQGGVSLQVLALFVGGDPAPEAISALFKDMLKEAEKLKQSGWVQADDPREVKAGETRFLLSIEGCEPFEPGLEEIARYRSLGVRMAAVTWNYLNKLGTPACINQTDGLSDYGLKAVKEMQRLGMAVDVSHLNIPGFYDILGKTNAPPLASHSCCRALRDHPRNLTDQQLKDLFVAGGYVGLAFYPNFLIAEGQPCGLDVMVNHFDHLHQLGGEGKVGFGSDFDGISRKVEGLDHPGDIPNLLDALRRRGYPESAVEAIAGKSFLEFFKRIA